MNRKSVRDSKGNIMSESKGFEQNNDSGLKRIAFQRRMNDKYHMRAKERKSRNEQWNEHQNLMNIEDDPDQIKKFHESFHKYGQIASSRKNRKRLMRD